MQTASKTLAQKAIAYGFDGIQVDGNDLFGVMRVTREAVEKARSGEGPTFIEGVTFRFGPHTTADDPTKYRKEKEIDPWKPDPWSA
jgi:pyruvate dehydrogenase E1 component alpha subunit